MESHPAVGFWESKFTPLVLGMGAVIKIVLAFFVIPKFGIKGEAGLLSGYFIVTTLALVMIGARVIRDSQWHGLQSEAL